MSERLKTGFLLTAIVLLTVIPLLTINAPQSGVDGEGARTFTGADTQAVGVIEKLAPGYQPWFGSLFKPPGSEIESLLFALQAALGAGVIGYYAGYVRGKRTRNPEPDVVDRAH